MPVLDHNTHPKTQFTESDQYRTCKNKVRGSGYRGPEGWIEHRMSKECRYDLSHLDKSCAGCKEVGKGKEYAESIISNT